MFLYRKNIILVPSDYDGISITKGLLSLDCYDNLTDCLLRCYNLNVDKNLILGVAINGKLNKFEINPKNAKQFDFKIKETIKNNDEISCVLLDIGQNDYNIILWGSTQINAAWKSTLQMMLESDNDFAIKPNQNKKNNENIIKKAENFEKKLQNNEIFKNINNHINIESFDNEKENYFENDKDLYAQYTQNQYKNFVDEQTNFSLNNQEIDEQSINNLDNIESKSSIYSIDDEEVENFIDKVIEMSDEESNTKTKSSIKKSNEEQTFFERLSPQINKMFESNIPEDVLNEIIPNSKFCRVEFDDKTGYYVFGIIYDETSPKYLCYGIPAQKGDKPPKEMSNLYQWFPIDTSDNTGDGFYMMYQDAETGKSISVDIV